MIILNGLWDNFNINSPIYKILEEITPQQYIVELISFNFEKRKQKSDLVIFVCGECLDIESLVKVYSDYVDVFISFQPDQIFNINNKKIVNIQCLLPIYNDGNYLCLNEKFKHKILNKKSYDFSIVVSNSTSNKYDNFNQLYSPDCCVNDLNLIQKRIEIGNSISNNIIKGGRAFNNIINDKISFIEKSKFNICFENVKHRYYITEKIFDSYLAGCIPIYCGDNFINTIFDKKYFVNCLDDKTNQLKSLDTIKKEAFEKYQFIKEMDINDLNIYSKNTDYVSQELYSLTKKLIKIINNTFK